MRELVRDLAQELEAEGIRSCGHGEHLVVDAQARIFWADNDPVLTETLATVEPANICNLRLFTDIHEADNMCEELWRK